MINVISKIHTGRPNESRLKKVSNIILCKKNSNCQLTQDNTLTRTDVAHQAKMFIQINTLTCHLNDSSLNSECPHCPGVGFQDCVISGTRR